AGHGGDLEDADGGPVTVSEIECSGVAGQGLRRGAVRRRHRGRGEGGRRLSTFTHLLTEAPAPAGRNSTHRPPRAVRQEVLHNPALVQASFQLEGDAEESEGDHGDTRHLAQADEAIAGAELEY